MITGTHHVVRLTKTQGRRARYGIVRVSDVTLGVTLLLTLVDDHQDYYGEALALEIARQLDQGSVSGRRCSGMKLS